MKRYSFKVTYKHTADGEARTVIMKAVGRNALRDGIAKNRPHVIIVDIEEIAGQR